MASLCCFIYHDDFHEMDFEIGFGDQDAREELGVSSDPEKNICYLSSQSSDGKSFDTRESKGIAIKGNAWYTLKLELTEDSGKQIIASWFIDGKQEFRLVHDWAMKTVHKKFCILVSLEQLPFMGEHGTSSISPPYEAKIRSVKFTPVK
eukprot:TRINITY_DN1007_c0_g1_i4.p1 TRINITY_DN1007_c0_g1~~TRINITY_DN1007_c0_g1_i4.p1  ORF type:complete len:149 (+),score=27.69 TRINITY_DN1007_c0_g1_i4:327-773(+)